MTIFASPTAWTVFLMYVIAVARSAPPIMGLAMQKTRAFGYVWRSFFRNATYAVWNALPGSHFAKSFVARLTTTTSGAGVVKPQTLFASSPSVRPKRCGIVFVVELS